MAKRKKHKKSYCVFASSKKGSKKISCHATKGKAKKAARARRRAGHKAAVKVRARKR
jgi:hypothetical protein